VNAKKLIIGGVFAVLILIIAVSLGWYSKSTYKFLSEGKRFLYYSEFDKAIASLEHVLEKDPGNIQANIYVGIAYGKKRDYKRALERFGRARQSDKYFLTRLPAKIHNDVGLIYYLLEQYDSAIEEFEKSVSIDPRVSETYFNLGVTYSISGRIYEAIAAYKKVLEIDPENSFSHWNLAVNLEKLGRKEEAIVHWEKYIAYVPGAFRHPDIQRHIDDLKGNASSPAEMALPAVKTGGEVK